MKRATPLVFSFSALSLALLAGLAFVGTATGTGAAASRRGVVTDGVNLSVAGSARMSGHRVTLTYAVTNDSALPVLAVALHGALYQGIDTDAPNGDPPEPFDCPLVDIDSSADNDAFALLWLGPGASAVCSATLEPAAGSYTAWLTASGYALSGRPPPYALNAPQYAPQYAQPSPERQCPAILLPVIAPCPLRQVSAYGAVPFDVLTPTSPPTSPPPSPSPPAPSPTPSPSPSATASASVSASPLPEPTTPSPPVSTSPAIHPLGLEQQAVPLPTRTEKPARMFMLLMVLPAVSAAAAVLTRRR